MSDLRPLLGAALLSSASLLVATSATAQEPAPSEPADVAPTGESIDSTSTPEESSTTEPTPDATASEASADSDESTQELASLSLEELLQIQVVESASRRAQSIHDAPSSVSLLRYDDIESMRGLNLAHPFRRLLGVTVMRYSTNAFRVHVRDPLSSSGNRVLVLVDGRTTIDPVIGYSPFVFLPYAPEDMESAEVIRGPGSMLYGANATGGVVSIRSRRPIDHPGAEGRLRAGANYIGDDDDVPDDRYRVDSVGLGYAAYNFANDARTVGLRVSLGTQTMPEAVPTISAAPRHGQFGYHGLVGLEIRPTTGASLYATATHSYSETYDVVAGDSSVTTVGFSEQAFTINYDHQDVVDDLLTVRATLDATRMAVHGRGTQESMSYHGVVQGDVSAWEGRNVTTVGVELARRASHASNLSPATTTFSLMAQDELKLFDDVLILNAALRWDHIAYDDGRGNDLVYRNLNPRGSVIWRPVEDHDFRFTVATAFRTPLPLESSIGAFFPPNNPGEPPIPIVTPNPALQPTKAQMLELGYRGDLFDRLRIDAAFALTRIVDDVRLRATASLPFVFANSNDVDVMTGELGLTGVISSNAEVFTNYVATRVHPTDSRDFAYSHLAHHVTLGGRGRFGDGYYAQGDFDIATGISSRGPTSAAGLLAIVTTDVPTSYDLNVRLGHYFLDDRVDVFLEGWNLVGLFADQSRLNRYTGLPFSTPVPATILIGIGLRGI